MSESDLAITESDAMWTVDLAIPETLALVPFLLVQVSMVAFILHRGRKDKTFRQAFYVFFVIATIADCTSVIANRLLFYTFSSLTVEFWEKRPTLAQALYVFAIVLQHVVFVADNCQPLGHLVVAFNRFTAFAFPLKHGRIWNPVVILILSLTTVSVAILLSGTPSVYLAVTYARLKASIDYNDRQSWEIDTIFINQLVRALNLIVCSFSSFVLNMGTVLMFILRRISSSTQISSQGQDVKLFVHALFVFALQLCLTFQCFILATDEFGYEEMLHDNGQTAALVVPSWLRLWSPEWLAGDANCVADISYVSAANGVTYCGAFYTVVTGYLPIGGGQQLAALIEYVFALSGAPLLLVVSGYVRTAYVQFYFKALRRRRDKVIQVVPTRSSKKS